MIKIIGVAFAALFSISTIAADILVIKAGSKSGSSAQRNNIYAEVLKEKGYDVTLTTNMHNELAVEMYNNATGPAMLVWIDALAGKYDVDYTPDEFMGIEYTVPLFLCTINENADPVTGIVAIQRNTPAAPVEAMGYKNFVPYKSSTNVTNAGIAGEVDFAYANKGGAKKLTELGKRCEQVPGLNQNGYTIAKNVDKDTMRGIVRDIINSPQMKKWQEGRGYTNNQATWDYAADLEYLRGQMELWSGAHKDSK